MYQVIRSITKDSLVVIGFSDGGITGNNLTAKHPELVKKLVAIGAPRGQEDRVVSTEAEGKITAERLEKIAPYFVNTSNQLMPDPARWNEFLDRLDTI